MKWFASIVPLLASAFAGAGQAGGPLPIDPLEPPLVIGEGRFRVFNDGPSYSFYIFGDSRETRFGGLPCANSADECLIVIAAGYRSFENRDTRCWAGSGGAICISGEEGTLPGFFGGPGLTNPERPIRFTFVALENGDKGPGSLRWAGPHLVELK